MAAVGRSLPHDIKFQFGGVTAHGRKRQFERGHIRQGQSDQIIAYK